MYTVQGSLFQPQRVLHLPSIPISFLHATAGGGMREGENYWESWRRNCRSNEKHLKTHKYENAGFLVNRKMQMIQILRFSCHYFFRPHFPSSLNYCPRLLQARRRPFGELGLTANQVDCAKKADVCQTLQIAPPLPIPIGYFKSQIRK